MSNSNLKVNVNWMIGWGNSPEIQVTGDVRPSFTYKEYKVREESDDRLYIGFDAEGIFSSYMLNVVKQRDPFRGAIDKDIELVDGTRLSLTGCWSSRTSVANMFLDEEDHIVECTLIDKFYRVAVRVSWLRNHLPEGVRLTKEIRDNGEISYSVLPEKGSAIWNELSKTKPELCKEVWIRRA